MNNPYQQGNNYHLVELQDKVNSASPHELINMLFQGAKTEIKSAILAVQHKRLDLQAKHISKAYNIVEGLWGSIDEKKGGEISKNLSKIYEYVMQTLMKANINNDQVLLENCYEQISNLAEAWQKIGPKEKV